MSPLSAGNDSVPPGRSLAVPIAAAELQNSYRLCQELAARTGKNFYYSFLTLPRTQFRSMCALYAFMRVTDDLGDEPRPVEEKASALDRWKQDLDAALAGETGRHPVLPAVVDMLRRHDVPVEYLQAVIAGVQSDLQPVDIATNEELSRYCYLVAGAVGLACIHVWGFRHERALIAAQACGEAFQRTNILRDLREDALNNRFYLPREHRLQFGCMPSDFETASGPERLRALMEFELARTRPFYARAEALLPDLEPVGRPILRAMLSIYGGIYRRIVKSPLSVFEQRVRLSRPHKLWIAARSALSGIWSP